MSRYLAIALLLVSCTDDEDAMNAARAIGLRDVVPGDYAPFSCSDDDVTAQHFTATNINGGRVTGVVCCGLVKRCTVRF